MLYYMYFIPPFHLILQALIENYVGKIIWVVVIMNTCKAYAYFFIICCIMYNILYNIVILILILQVSLTLIGLCRFVSRQTLLSLFHKLG